MNHGMKKAVVVMSLLLALCVGVVFALFLNLSLQYRRGTASAGASHLIEINLQGKENILSRLDRGKFLALDISGEMEEGRLTSEAELLPYAREHKQLWGADDVYFYTAAGICVNADGAVQSGGDAAEFAYETLQNGDAFRLIKSQAEYACSVRSSLEIQGSEIVAVSVIQNLDNLIDDMNFKPFGGSGSVYLCRENGVRVCQSSGDGVRTVYNLTSLFKAGTADKLIGDWQTLPALMASGAEAAFLYRETGSDAEYVVFTPITFRKQNLYLVTIVPQAVVNETLNTFSNRVLFLSSGVIVLIVLLFAGFFVLYRRKERSYDAGIRSREYLFDLLVSETSNAFMLFDVGRAAPVYVSSNTEQVLGTTHLRLRRAAQGFVLESGTAEVRSGLAEVNSALSGWDGSKPFFSGYLPTARAQKEPRYLKLGLYPIAADSSEYIGIVRDATPEYEREKSLQEAIAMADSANKAKTQFLSSVSHDIRTPLNAIINMVRFLEKDIDSRDKALGEIAVIEQSSEHLLGLINDVLDLSRIESGKLALMRRPFSMNAAAQGVCRIIRPLCEAKKQKFLPHTDGIVHANLLGDAVRLNQILINVLNNAMKFTPEKGEIEFTVEELPSIKENLIPFRFTVRDNGIGISPENIQTIFSPFARDNRDVVRQTEGSGLGLAITKNLVEAQGGTITVESEIGKGSVFTIALCFAADAGARPERPAGQVPENSAVRFDGLCALVAEDNRINLEIARTILEQWGFAVETAENGAAALQKFTDSPVGSIRMIYMDIQMPVMDGYEAAKAIRSCGRPDAAAVPIIAMTANAFSEDVERARAAGMNAHTAKPIDPEEVHRITAELLSEKGGGRER
jgi:signal transduction histidine kinase/CheY-like chemotaxis protein